MTDVRGRPFTWLLIVWTLGIWGSRIRNIVADDDLAGAERVIAIAVAISLISFAVATAVTNVLDVGAERLVLGALVGIGIVRWTLRGPAILLSDEWDASFKAVHTVLWLVTVALSVLAWREHRRHVATEAG